MRLSAGWLAGILACAAVTGQAGAQVETREGIALQNQIAELRQALQAMQQNQPTGGAAPYQTSPYQSPGNQPPGPGPGGDTAAELVVRVGALEEQVRTLQGRVDDLSNQLQRQHDELTKQIGDLAFKLGQSPAPAPESSRQPIPPPAGQAPTVHVPPAPAHRTPELALRDGNAALVRHDYPAAEAAAREAMAGRSPRVADGQLLLARAEGGQHLYKQSAADYYQAYSHSPRAATAPIALLGVANALIAMGDQKDACQALGKLATEFPGSTRSAVGGARKRAGCGR